MIESTIRVVIQADNDEAVDRVIKKLHQPYDPEVLNVHIREIDREEVKP